MNTHCFTSDSVVSSTFWDSFPNINADDNSFSKLGQSYQASLNYESLSRALGLIDCAEDVMSSSIVLFDEADLEPRPIGDNVADTAAATDKEFLSLFSDTDLTDQGRGEILDNYINSIKRRSDTEDDDTTQPNQKRQRASSFKCTIPFVADAASEVQAKDVPTENRNRNGKGARFRRYQADQWMQRFEDLVDFREEHGNCLVPHSYPPNQQLAQWVKRQRYQHKLKMDGVHSTLTDARQKELEDMGFVWDSHKAAWFERLEALKVYRAQHGDCMVPTNYELDRPLAVWVKCQRRQLKLFRQGKRSTMTEERFQELGKLGFEWNPRKL